MSYYSILNLYKDPTILMFREVFSLEKIHGCTAWATWRLEHPEWRFHAGAGSHKDFVSLFNLDLMQQVALDIGKPITVYGEYYGGFGGKGQGMAKTYGDASRFIVFDIKINDLWLSVPNMQEVADRLGLETVFWEKIPATIEAIDAARDADSVQAIRNGMGPGHKREGVVLRPLIELVKNNGQRVIAKHRRSEFIERQKEPSPLDAERLEVLDEAQAIAEEWVVPMRIVHVTQKLTPPLTVKDTGRVVAAVQEDILREATGEIVPSQEALRAIGRRAATMFRDWLATQEDQE